MNTEERIEKLIDLHESTLRCIQSLIATLNDHQARMEALERAVRAGPDPRLWAGDAHDPYRR